MSVEACVVVVWVSIYSAHPSLHSFLETYGILHILQLIISVYQKYSKWRTGMLLFVFVNRPEGKLHNSMNKSLEELLSYFFPFFKTAIQKRNNLVGTFQTAQSDVKCKSQLLRSDCSDFKSTEKQPSLTCSCPWYRVLRGFWEFKADGGPKHLRITAAAGLETWICIHRHTTLPWGDHPSIRIQAWILSSINGAEVSLNTILYS